jgi:transcriptional regulator with XRE-family HTH domain
VAWTADDDIPIPYRITELGRHMLLSSPAPREEVTAFAEWLRETHRYQVTGLARLTGYSVGHISAVLNGRRAATKLMLAALRVGAADLVPAVNARCRVCVHDDRAEIELASLTDPFREIAAQFGLTTNSVWRHWWRHVPDCSKRPSGVPRATSEGRTMAAELARILRATGRYNVTAIARHVGRDRAQVWRIFNGGSVSVYLVEEIALAVGVDLAFLYPAASSVSEPEHPLRVLVG